jgi:hypothetical protein
MGTVGQVRLNLNLPKDLILRYGSFQGDLAWVWVRAWFWGPRIYVGTRLVGAIGRLVGHPAKVRGGHPPPLGNVALFLWLCTTLGSF